MRDILELCETNCLGGFMVKNIVLNIAEKILSKHPHWSPEINGVILQRMSKDFHTWVYNEGYKLYKEKQFASHNSDYTKCHECGEIYLNSEVQPHTGLCGYCNPPF